MPHDHTDSARILPQLPLLLPAWNIFQWRLRNDLNIAGSPNRSDVRLTLENAQEELFVLEGVCLSQKDRRERQARQLQTLQDAGFSQLLPWLRTQDASFGRIHGGMFWQLRRYMPSLPLPRERYGLDTWRGQVLASMLEKLRNTAASVSFEKEGAFRLAHYISRQLMPFWKLHRPALWKDTAPMQEELRPFFQEEPHLATAFCHGDFHPGNVLWASHDAAALIDWEFCGMKTALHDAANLLGCLGMDEPAWLTGPCATAFLQGLRENTSLDDASWHFLPELVAALRFGWLREWAVLQDKAMLQQELDFLWLLLDNRELLRKRWQCPA